MNSSTNSINDNNRNNRLNNTCEINPRNPRRYYGDITLEMINDYLNPEREKKDKTVEILHKVPEPATNGMGLRDKNKYEDDEDVLLSNSFFNKRENKDNVNYAKSIRKEFERELKQSYAISNNNLSINNNNNKLTTRDDRSLIGSAMSQLESVTTMNVSTNQRFKSMQQAKFFNDRTDDGSIIDSNNNTLAAELNDAANLQEINLGEKRNQDFLELCKNWKKRSTFDQPNLPITDQKEQILNKINFFPFLIIRGSTGCGKTTQVPQFILDDHINRKKYCSIIITQPRRIAATR
jgi:hypothetical protein